MEEHYAEDDTVLAKMQLPEECSIRIDIDDSTVRLFIGPRDYEWRRGCPFVVACGTLFNPDRSEDGD